MPQMTLTAEIQPEQMGQRLDQTLAELFPEYSRSRLKTWIEAKQVKMNGEIADIPRAKVYGGEQIEISVEVEDENRFEPQNIPLNIVYEDDDIIVINQPTDLSIAELYSKMNFMMKNDRTFSNELVLAGGPVHSERGFILHKKTAKEFEHSYKITDEMFLTTSADIVETFGSEDAPEKYLVALGCASWTAGQLEQEIADNAWLVAPASDTILFETIYEDRYPAANQLLGINPHNFVFSQVGHS
jgi:putative transcriptional regulator